MLGGLIVKPHIEEGVVMPPLYSGDFWETLRYEDAIKELNDEEQYRYHKRIRGSAV